MGESKAQRWLVAIVTAYGLAASGGEQGAAAEGEKTDHDLPPYVVKTEPAAREKDVDFTVREIRATFDRPMQTDRSWSWIIHRNLGLYPGYRGAAEPRWEDGGRTCVLAVRLSPDTLYAVGVNSVRHSGFRDPSGKVAVPYVWVFKTRAAKGTGK